MLVEAATMAVPLLVSLYYGETPRPFLFSMLIILIAGALLSLLRGSRRFYAREGFFAVGLIWLLLGIGGALPFWFSGYFSTFTDCIFESISGFTTTGASILSSVENLPMGILFWRSETHFLGGMGVLVLTTALIPSLGESSKYLIRAESPGPVKSKLVPKASQSSRILYSIYCVMTVVMIVCLRFTGMRWFDCVANAMATAGTGGFSVLNSSIAGYHSSSAEIIITIFMLLFSVNFSVYFLLITGRVKQALKSDELRFFLLLVAFSTVTIAINIAPGVPTWGDAARLAAFQVASIISTTGFATADFNLWPEYSRMLLVLLMFCGACAGSTGGGVKCSRVLLIVRGVRREIRQIIHPNSVNLVRLDGKVMDESSIHTAMVFLGAYLGVWMGASLLVSLDSQSLETTATAVLSCLSNVGPGMGGVGPVCNYGFFSSPSKLILSLTMIIGRLEIFPILILFSRSAWRRY